MTPNKLTTDTLQTLLVRCRSCVIHPFDPSVTRPTVSVGCCILNSKTFWLIYFRKHGYFVFLCLIKVNYFWWIAKCDFIMESGQTLPGIVGIFIWKQIFYESRCVLFADFFIKIMFCVFNTFNLHNILTNEQSNIILMIF